MTDTLTPYELDVLRDIRGDKVASILSQASRRLDAQMSLRARGYLTFAQARLTPKATKVLAGVS